MPPPTANKGYRPIRGSPSPASSSSRAHSSPSHAQLLPPGSAASPHGSNFSHASSPRPSMDLWASATSGPEPDDWLHVMKPGEKDRRWAGVDLRGILNVFTLLLVLFGILMLFAGYPLLQTFLHKSSQPLNLNSTGQVPTLPNLRQLIDPDTPAKARKWYSSAHKLDYELVFSDEFQLEGRTFWPGDDPYWEAVDLWYKGTNDFEWYQPEQINTTDGALTITMAAKETHNLNFASGMLQSWNKFCFQGGYIEMAALLPGTAQQRGFWPGLWTMGNLGRPGYLGSTDGMWPYSYQACDWGTLKNQTSPDGSEPESTLNAQGQWSWQYDHKLSFLPGQRTSSCTCPGEAHPGPHVGIGRAAPEIDILEAQNNEAGGHASQSLQTAPFDADYWWNNATAKLYPGTEINSYTGSVFQEAVSGVSPIPDKAFIDAPNAEYTTFGFEYQPDFDGDGSEGFVTWWVDDKPTWTAPASTVGPNPTSNVSQRLIPREPMSIIINLAISSGFSTIDWDKISFPATMKVDYVRVYQRPGQTRVSCDPPDHPTAKYINDHIDLYMNPNYTIFPKEKYDWPKNRLLEPCT